MSIHKVQMRMFFLLLIFPFMVNAQTNTYSKGITCAVGICLDKRVSRQEVYKKLGKGKIYERVSCYRLGSDGPFVSIEFDDHSSDHMVNIILVSKKEICKSSKIVSKSFIRSEDMSVLSGDKNSIIKLFNSPAHENALEKNFWYFSRDEGIVKSGTKIGDHYLTYTPEGPEGLLLSKIFLENGKVSAFLISDAE